MKIITILVITIFIFGCDVLNNPKKLSTDLKIPLKITTKIPKFLYDPSKKKSRQIVIKDKELEDWINKKTPTFELTQDLIMMFLDIKETMRTNNKITNQVLMKIKQKCTTFDVNEVCSIKKDEISFLMNQQFLQELQRDENTAEDLDIKVGEEVRFGSIEFTKFKNINRYDYAINIDFTDVIKVMYSDVEFRKIIHSTSWSEDDKTILSTIFLIDNNGEETTLTINYEETLDAQEKMSLFNKNINSINSVNSINNISITNYFDEKQTTTALLDGIFMDSDINITIGHSSFMKVNNQTGLQIVHWKNSFDANKTEYLISNDIIDSNGLLKATTFCFDDATTTTICSIDDRQSWYTSTENMSVFLPLVEPHQKYNMIDLKNINLIDGSYSFIPSNLYQEDLTVEDVLRDRVGEFVVMSREGYGIWSEKGHSFDDANLTLLYAKYNEKLDTPLKDKDVEYFKKIR